MFPLAKERCCWCLDLRIRCYIIAYILLACHIALAAWVVFITATKPSEISIKDPVAMKKLAKILELGFLFPVAQILINFDRILFRGLNKKSRFLINIFVVFSKYELMVFVAACITFQFFYPMDPYANAGALSIPIQAYFIHVIRSYWKQLEPVNTKKQKLNV